LSRLAAVIEERLAFEAPARRLRLAVAADLLSSHFGDRPIRVLDAGCGDGLQTLALARRHPRWSLLGVDRREDLLAGARERAVVRSLGNVRFEAADLEQPLQASGLDAVVALECLSEIRDDVGAARNMAEALSPGGLLVAQVPDRDWRAVLPGSPSTWREQVRQGYALEDLADLVEGAGLEVLELRPTFHTAVAAAQEIRDRIKERGLWLRLLAFAPLQATVALERMGIAPGRANALLVVARRPPLT
jgi:trans-aconitate methyltransferase